MKILILVNMSCGVIVTLFNIYYTHIMKNIHEEQSQIIDAKQHESKWKMMVKRIEHGKNDLGDYTEKFNQDNKSLESHFSSTIKNEYS